MGVLVLASAGIIIPPHRVTGGEDARLSPGAGCSRGNPLRSNYPKIKARSYIVVADLFFGVRGVFFSF